MFGLGFRVLFYVWFRAYRVLFMFGLGFRILFVLGLGFRVLFLKSASLCVSSLCRVKADVRKTLPGV